MREHPGIRDDQSSIGDGYVELTNISHYVEMELRRRPGLWYRMAGAGVAIGELFDPVDGTFAAQVTEDGEIITTEIASNTNVNILQIGYNVDFRPTAMTSNGDVYFNNDFDRQQVVTQSNKVRQAGIRAPTAAPTLDDQSPGNCTPGTHLIRYRYYSSTTGYYSSASEVLTVDVTSYEDGLLNVTGDGNGSWDLGLHSFRYLLIDTDTDEVSVTSPVVTIQVTDQTSEGLLLIDGLNSITVNTIDPKYRILIQATPANSVQWYDAADVAIGVASIQLDIDDATLITQGTTDTANPTLAPDGQIDIDGFLDPETASLDHADQLLIQMTTAGGTNFFDVAFLDRADFPLPTDVYSISIADQNLAQQTTTGTALGVESERPPGYQIGIEHRKRAFGIGTTVRDVLATVTNGSDTVTIADASELWIGRVFRVGIETVEYAIKDVSGSTVTLETAYAGPGSGPTAAAIYSNSADLLVWSQPGLPEQYNPSDARRVFADVNDVPKGMISQGNDLYVFGRNSISILTYTENPAFGGLSQVANTLGVWNHHCLVRVDNAIYGWGPAGAWRMAGALPVHISRPVEGEERRSQIDGTQADRFTGVYDSRERVISWYYVPVGESEPTRAFCLDVDRNKWTERVIQHGVIGSTTMRDPNDEQRAFVAGSDGTSWFLRNDVYDGVEPGGTSIVTSDSGSTTTTIFTNEAVQTSPSLIGTYLYRLNTEEELLITDNTANSITVQTPYGSTIEQGEVFYIGRIPATIMSEWRTQGDASILSRPGNLMLETNPDVLGGEAEIEIFKDFSDQPLQWTAVSDDVFPDGVIVTSDGRLLVSLSGGTRRDGFVPLPSFSDNARFWKTRFSTDRPEGRLQYMDMRIRNNPEDMKRELQE